MEIFMVDAAFLIKLLLENSEKPQDRRVAGSLGGPRDNAYEDMILAENQLPMFILEDIFNTWIRPKVIIR